MPPSASSCSSFASAVADLPRCPFSGAAASPEGGRCPFAAPGRAGAPLPPGHPPISASPAADPVAIDDRLLSAAKALMERGMALPDAAKMLRVEEATLAAAASQGGAAMMAGRTLNSTWQDRLDKLTAEDPELCCPVSLVLFAEPVIASDGFMYEKASLEGLLKNRMASPMTREALKKEFIPARQRKSDTIHFRETRSEELLKFAGEALEPQPRMAAAALERVSEYLEALEPARVPSLARQAAGLWRKLGGPLPRILQAF